MSCMAETKRPPKSRAPRVSTSRKIAKPNTPGNTPAPAYESKYTVGDHISHPMFGDGAVTAIEVKKLTIEFPGGVTKQIIDDYVKHRGA